jgi:hypothetical protein
MIKKITLFILCIILSACTGGDSINAFDDMRNYHSTVFANIRVLQQYKVPQTGEYQQRPVDNCYLLTRNLEVSTIASEYVYGAVMRRYDNITSDNLMVMQLPAGEHSFKVLTCMTTNKELYDIKLDIPFTIPEEQAGYYLGDLKFNISNRNKQKLLGSILKRLNGNDIDLLIELSDNFADTAKKYTLNVPYAKKYPILKHIISE